MTTPNRRRRLVRDGSAPHRRSVVVPLSDLLIGTEESFLPPQSPTALEQFTAGHAEYIKAAEANHAWRRARQHALELLRAEGPALGLSLIDLAEVCEGHAQDLRRQHQEAKLAADKVRR